MIQLSPSEMKVLSAVMSRMRGGLVRVDYDSLCDRAGFRRSFISSCLSQFVGYRILRRVAYATYERGPCADEVTLEPVPEPRSPPTFRAAPKSLPVAAALAPSSIRPLTKDELMRGRA